MYTVTFDHRGKTMKSKIRSKRHFPLFLIGGTIPTVIILSSVFNLPKAAAITLLIILILIFSSMALWTYANRDADGSEWWQDDNASGWRGY
jgi:ABC-type transport system involved in cytochrome bd biosynthesis fused ATPase/permease subunit